MNTKLFFAFIASFNLAIAQDVYQTSIRTELVQWDAVRGEWLAESFQAMAANQPIPDRNFPEDLTPAEMYALVPTERRERINTILAQPSNTTQNRVPTTDNSTINRIPVGSTPNQLIPASASHDRYTYFVSRPGCELVSGRTYGDPHIRTFDDKSYSFQTVGEYILAASPDRNFEVQTRQKPETDKVSLNTAAAMNVYGDRVGIYASDFPDGQTGTPIRVNGRPVYISNETFYLPHGGTIQNNGREYIVTWPTGEKVQARLSSSGSMRFINVTVYVYRCNGNYYGLMGNANGRSDDDFSSSNNRFNMASSSIFAPFDSRTFGQQETAMEREQLAFLAKDFGRQFLVNDQISLFDYAFGQSSWTFYDPTFPREHITLGDIAQTDRDRARRECERLGVQREDMAGCVLDMAHVNLTPSPRPTQPDRTTGRIVTPVTSRQPNVNRPDVFERVPSSTGTRTPNTTISNGTIDKTNSGSVERTKNPGTAVEQNSDLRQPVETVRPNPTIKHPETNPVERQPSSTINNDGLNRKPVGESGVTKSPSVEKPASNGSVERQPTPSRTKSPSTTTTNPTRTPNSVSRPVSTNPVSKPVENTKVQQPSSTVTSPSRTTTTSRPSTGNIKSSGSINTGKTSNSGGR